MLIREATLKDYDAIWEIFSAVIQAGDTYVYDPKTPKEDLAKLWFAPYMKTFVVEENKHIAGTYIIKPNQVDLGSHVANCSYMVHPNFRGKGIGGMMCKHSLEFGQTMGYKAMQFNIVVSTNTVAIALWQKHGFNIIGTIPKAFRHAPLGFVDAYIMYRSLE